MTDIFRLLFSTILCFFRARRSLLLENLALHQQLAVLKRKHRRPRLEIFDRFFWVIACRFWSGWQRALIVVTPETVVRWHRATVSGVTTIRASFHPDQNRLTVTQKSLSTNASRGRGRRRFKTASCCRSTRFSKTRFPRLRKRRISTPIQRRSRLDIARSYTRIRGRDIAVSY